MSNLDAICDKILQDARSEAEEILAAADLEIRKRREAEEERARAEAERRIRYTQDKMSALSEQIMAHASLSARDRLLSVKQDVISTVMTRAEQRIRELSNEDLLQKIMHSIGDEGLNPGDALILPPGTELELPADIPLERDPQIASGFALRRGGIIEKHDFVEVLGILRNELEQDILKVLREQENA